MKMKRTAYAVMTASLLASWAFAGESAAIKDQKAKDSYSLGYSFGRNITGQGIELDKDVLISAIRDAMDGKKAAMSEAELKETVGDMRRRSFAYQERQVRELTAKNLAESNAFLEANKKKEGVITLPSGLQYKVLRDGKGAGPKETDGVKVRYRGMLANGTEFDNIKDLSDNDLPVIPVAGGHEGWSQALQLMKPGAKWQVVVPPQLGFGDKPNGNIPANSVLVYDLELLSVVDRGSEPPVVSGMPAPATEKQN